MQPKISVTQLAALLVLVGQALCVTYTTVGTAAGTGYQLRYNSGTSCSPAGLTTTDALRTYMNNFANDLKAALPSTLVISNICHVGSVRTGCTCGSSGSWHCCSPPRAIDLSEIYLTNGQKISMYRGDHVSADITRVRRYIGVSALARRNFRYVLDGYWAGDSAHNNHIHVDDGALPTAFGSGSSSDVSFIQGACQKMNNQANVAIDGVYGPITDGCVQSMKTKLGVSGSLATASVYRDFLLKLAKKALAGVAL